MKTQISKLIASVLFLTLLGCSSDSPTVSDPNACTPIPCLNGGVSTPSCGCACPDGYSGVNCSVQLTPSKIFITKVRITKFPNLRTDGSDWDSLAAIPFVKPDVFPVIFDSSGAIVIFRGAPAVQNAFSYSADQFDFFPSSPIQINDASTKYRIVVYDEDSSSSNEFMGGFNTGFYDSNKGFPEKLTIGTANDVVRFELTLSYVW